MQKNRAFHGRDIRGGEFPQFGAYALLRRSGELIGHCLSLFLIQGDHRFSGVDFPGLTSEWNDDHTIQDSIRYIVTYDHAGRVF